jgi:hypothetical protein
MLCSPKTIYAYAPNYVMLLKNYASANYAMRRHHNTMNVFYALGILFAPGIDALIGRHVFLF